MQSKIIIAAALIAAAAHAGSITNSGFETGDFTGWDVDQFSTDVMEQGITRGLTSPFGTDAIGDPVDPVAYAGSYYAEVFSTNSETESSGWISQTFTADAGQVLSFAYFADFDELDTDTSVIDVVTITLASISGTTTLVSLSSTSGDTSGWLTFATGALAAGSYTVRFEISDGSGLFESVLGIDDVRLTGGGGVLVPLPTAGALAGAGLMSLGVRRRRA